MKYLSILSSGFFALVLLGAGCSVTTPTDVTVADVVVDEPAVVRMVDFHNNYVPTFDMAYDANMFDAAVGSGIQLKEATNDFLTVNNAVVSFIPVGTDSPTLQDASLVMMFINGEVTRDQIEASIVGTITSSEDKEVAGFDAYVFEMADGNTRTAWPTSKGYYLMSVLDSSAQSIADSLSF